MALQQGIKSFQANDLEIPLYRTSSCIQETVADDILLSYNRKRCKIAITEKCARIKQTPETLEAAAHNEFFAVPVYRVKEFSMECREKR